MFLTYILTRGRFCLDLYNGFLIVHKEYDFVHTPFSSHTQIQQREILAPVMCVAPLFESLPTESGLVLRSLAVFAAQVPSHTRSPHPPT